jgi:hypothetical protein
MNLIAGQHICVGDWGSRDWRDPPWPRRSAILACAVLSLSGCTGGAARDGKSQQPLVPSMAGLWTLELRGGTGLGTTVNGSLSLTADTTAYADCSQRYSAAVCRRRMIGTHDLNVTPLVGYELSSQAAATIDERGTLVLVLGQCCDRGEISASGGVGDTIIAGRWVEQRTAGDVRRGTFRLARRELHRPPSPP